MSSHSASLSSFAFFLSDRRHSLLKETGDLLSHGSANQIVRDVTPLVITFLSLLNYLQHFEDHWYHCLDVKQNADCVYIHFKPFTTFTRKKKEHS